ncbi:hypothetical protein H375_7000 [Rickettsia prowazekii str. Breinl]|nr:hypothetical protein H375_7000 [Rickettsia prowazekii str. Breinl]
MNCSYVHYILNNCCFIINAHCIYNTRHKNITILLLFYLGIEQIQEANKSYISPGNDDDIDSKFAA